MARLVEGCFHLLKAAIASCLVLMVVLVFGNVVLRYAFMGITTSEELSRFFFVWMTFLGAIVALREHGHLGSDPPRRTNSARNLPQLPRRRRSPPEGQVSREARL